MWQQIFDINDILKQCLHRLYALNNKGCRSASAVANSRDTILTGLKLVKECRQNSRSRAAQRMAKGDGTS